MTIIRSFSYFLTAFRIDLTLYVCLALTLCVCLFAFRIALTAGQRRAQNVKDIKTNLRE